MAGELDKYIERAADVLIAFANKEKQNLPSTDDAAKVLLQSKEDLHSVEVKFSVNSIDIIYQHLKNKYPDIAASEKVDKLLKLLKSLSDKEDADSLSKAKLVYSQLYLEVQYLENKISAEHPEYKHKLEN